MAGTIVVWLPFQWGTHFVTPLGRSARFVSADIAFAAGPVVQDVLGETVARMIEVSAARLPLRSVGGRTF
jgi:hypothetical protein